MVCRSASLVSDARSGRAANHPIPAAADGLEDHRLPKRAEPAIKENVTSGLGLLLKLVKHLRVNTVIPQMSETTDLRDKPAENPKAIAGRQKIEYANTPALPALYQAAVHDLGAGKYGSFNWRDRPIKLADYISAMRRHLAELEAGVDIDAESGLPHCAHLMATYAIVIDAQAAGTLIDNRRPTPDLASEMQRIAELKKGWPRAA